jgi:molybdate transport system substrate-binding protein
MDQNLLNDFWKPGRRNICRLGVLLMAALVGGAAQAADPIKVFSAGSLNGVMQELIAASGLPQGAVASPVFGPAGMLRQRLMAGEPADLFTSADLAQARAVAEASHAVVVPFARNRMCVVAPERLGLTADSLLERLLSPEMRLATSTPGADPGGDYARSVFARADAVHPGAQAILSSKAMLLVGGPAAITPQPGHSAAATIFLGNHADALMYYCSSAAGTLREMPGLVSIPLPDALEVWPVYGLTVLSSRPEAAQLALFLVSERGQAILVKGGLLPLVKH